LGSTDVIAHGDFILAQQTIVIVRSEASQRLMATVRRIATTPATVLIEGETGTGKELVARAIHEFSPRGHKPWVDVNCSALPEHLLESELFGHEKGAFTGADCSKPGMFELAHEGTLFLDEIGELDPKIQAKLLRVLDGAPFYRLGGTRKISVDVRIVAATNRDLEAAVRKGTFRKDLFFRLGQMHVRISPLRERPEDVVAIAEKVLNEHRAGARFNQRALDALCAYTWPGNVRELRNIIMSLITLSDCQAEIDVDDLPEQITAATPNPLHGASPTAIPAENAIVPLGDLDSMERVMIEDALFACDGDQAQAADRLGISRRTLTRKLKLYRLEDSCRTASRDTAGSRQRYFRAALDRIVTLRSSTGHEVEARSVNVSLTGIGLHQLSESFPCAGIIDLTFSLEEGSPSIEVKGKMTWADGQGHTGIRFVSMSRDAQHLLKEWLETQLPE
jgi:transcriptional regulator with PAS, ATPase and Fis domain